MINEFEASLIEKKFFTPDVLFLKFKLREGKLSFSAGQYLQLKIGDQRRCYSIASPEHLKDSFEFVIRLLPEGLASNFFRDLKVGEFAKFLGPFGVFTLKSNDKNKIFFAGGTGIAPIRSQIFTLFHKNCKASLILFWGLKTKESVYFFEEFKKLSENYKNFSFKICLDEEKDFSNLDKNYFFEGRVQNAFLEWKENRNLNEFEYYLCGPPKMVEALKEFLLNLGIQKENVVFERF